LYKEDESVVRSL